MSIMLVDFSYHLQIHDWGLIYFHLKEENAWDIIFEVTNFGFFFSRGQVLLVFIRLKITSVDFH